MDGEKKDDSTNVFARKSDLWSRDWPFVYFLVFLFRIWSVASQLTELKIKALA